MPRKDNALTWRKDGYRESRAFNSDGRLVGEIEWDHVADDWSASFAWTCPYKQLGTYNSEARAQGAVEAEYARMAKGRKRNAPND